MTQVISIALFIHDSLSAHLHYESSDYITLVYPKHFLIPVSVFFIFKKNDCCNFQKCLSIKRLFIFMPQFVYRKKHCKADIGKAQTVGF